MRLYLVRHAQTEGNATSTYQSAESVFSEKGKQQEEYIIKRFTHVSLDAVITSPHIRTRVTAQQIATKKHIPLISSELVREHRWPSMMVGRSKLDPEIIKVREHIEKAWITNPEWRHSDEERFIDIKQRALDFLDYAKNLEYANALVVSHARFLKVLITVIIHGANTTAHMFNDIFYNISLNNTGITVVEYANGRWHLVTVNDHAHLGDYERQPH